MCLTHYMVVHKGLKSLTISTRFLYWTTLNGPENNPLKHYWAVCQFQLSVKFEIHRPTPQGLFITLAYCNMSISDVNSCQWFYNKK